MHAAGTDSSCSLCQYSPRFLQGEKMKAYIGGMTSEEALELRIERLEDALHKIDSWSQAYPLEVFPEPDLKKARELLEAGGITLDSVSAHCMRHVVTGVGEIARVALHADKS